jgi:uncharacterized membrane protein
VRGFLIGFVMLVAVGLSILSLRRGGLRRQLRFAARRFRLALALGAAYVVISGVIRFVFPEGPVSDFGPPVLALALLAIFVVLGQDPAVPAGPGPGTR